MSESEMATLQLRANTMGLSLSEYARRAIAWWEGVDQGNRRLEAEFQSLQRAFLRHLLKTGGVDKTETDDDPVRLDTIELSREGAIRETVDALKMASRLAGGAFLEIHLGSAAINDAVTRLVSKSRGE
jgi:hypothetical protein